MSRPARTPVAIALGSNLGDRRSHLTFAIERLGSLLSDLRVSSWRDTEPLNVGPQPMFLNAVVTGGTSRPARLLLADLLQIERERGRQRPHAGAPRTLDLDLLLYGSEIIDETDLRVPHPRFRERLFVLEPLAEIARDWIDPETQKTIGELLRNLVREEAEHR